MPKYVKTAKLLADEIGMTTQALFKNWTNKDGFPIKTQSGWNVQACLKFIRDHKAAKDADTGIHADLKGQKLQREITILDEKIKALRRETIPMDEHLQEIGEHAQMCRAVLDQWIEQVATVTKDAALKAEAERLRDMALTRMRELLEDTE